MTNTDIDKLFKHIDSKIPYYIDTLADAVAIPSVSGDPKFRPEVIKMAEFLKKHLENVGAEAKFVPMGTFEGLEVPPVIFAQLGKDSKKKTVCIYGHYDVQPAEKSDGWHTEPFKLVEIDEKLYGRGSSDEKGPILGWIHAITAYQQTNQVIPVNIKFCLEGTEESDSIGLEALVIKEAKSGGFLSDVDYFCISDNYWLGKNKPCLTYGLRGICYYYLEVSSGTKDLHSGVFGGSVPECMVDLVTLLSKLVDNKGKILIPGIYDDVAPLHITEHDMYSNIDFNLHDFKADAGVHNLLHDTAHKTLMHRWRYPSLSIHGIEGAFYGSGSKTVIPHKVIGKFSIRVVPHQHPDKLHTLVKSYIESEFAKLNSPNKTQLHVLEGSKAWVSQPDHPNYIAGRNATKRVYGVEPDMTREGGSIPITLTFEEATGKNVLLLPMGASDDGAHSTNEKLNIKNYIYGIKLLSTYLDEVAKV